MKFIPSYKIKKAATEEEAKECAELMSCSDPWITLNRSFEQCLEIFLDKENDLFVLLSNDNVIGFVVVKSKGILTPYIQSIGIREEFQNKGIGTHVLAEIERMYSSLYPNIFISVSF
jgi:ribosomal protein S18 acetylase RimI-like enzyme